MTHAFGRRSYSEPAEGKILALWKADRFKDRRLRATGTVQGEATNLPAEFLVEPVPTIVTPPNQPAHKPTGNGASRDDHRP